MVTVSPETSSPSTALSGDVVFVEMDVELEESSATAELSESLVSVELSWADAKKSRNRNTKANKDLYECDNDIVNSAQ